MSYVKMTTERVNELVVSKKLSLSDAMEIVNHMVAYSLEVAPDSEVQIKNAAAKFEAFATEAWCNQQTVRTGKELIGAAMKSGMTL
jgi:hypothetical protein